MEQSTIIARNLFNEARVLHGDLNQAIDDREARKIRNQLREKYTDILFLDYKFAHANNVEFKLWNAVFYKTIKEYRDRVRKVRRRRKDPRISENKKEQLKRVCTSFRLFLVESSEFYENLVKRFSTSFGLNLDHSMPDDCDDMTNKLYLSCHSCFIHLGDLYRYHYDLYGDPNQGEWKKASIYYSKALILLPTNGTPYNQLAVLCTYSDDSFRTLYNYYRSLSVETPFMTTGENISVLFKREYDKIKKQGRSSNSLKAHLQTFVQIQRIFYCKEDVISFKKLRSEFLNDFGKYLNNGTINDRIILKMMVINICSIHESKSTSIGREDNNLIFQLTKSFAMDCFYRILRHSIKKSHQESGLSSSIKHSTQEEGLEFPLGKPISIFCSWLSKNMYVLDFPENEEDINLWNHVRNNLVELVNIYFNNDVDERLFNRPLPEENHLRGFIPLIETFEDIDFGYPSISGDIEKGKRIQKVINFAIKASQYEWNMDENFLYFSRNIFSVCKRDVIQDNINDITSEPNLDDSEEDINDILVFDFSKTQISSSNNTNSVKNDAGNNTNSSGRKFEGFDSYESNPLFQSFNEPVGTRTSWNNLPKSLPTHESPRNNRFYQPYNQPSSAPELIYPFGSQNNSISSNDQYSNMWNPNSPLDSSLFASPSNRSVMDRHGNMPNLHGSSSDSINIEPPPGFSNRQVYHSLPMNSMNHPIEYPFTSTSFDEMQNHRSSGSIGDNSIWGFSEMNFMNLKPNDRKQVLPNTNNPYVRP
eukprot:TRINITY_DN3754_c0_g3_i1.p1 TRINITY_DN3754_c0_g3~~TRINITY_DN3754_c0_g3_i1.p1  ORF type:complete len:761 (-),score=107.47 TRINITY_DN3754_c0_g3_i1:1184-3466(-)